MKYHTAVERLSRLVLLLWLVPSSGAAEEAPRAVGVRPSPRQPRRIAVVRKAACQTYEEVIAELRDRVRGTVRVAPAVDDERHDLSRWVGRYDPDLLVAVGQSAYDLLRDVKDRPLIHALVYHRTRAVHAGIPGKVPPDHVLKIFRLANPAIQKIAVLHGQWTVFEMEQAHLAAIPLGMTLVPLRSRSPRHAVALLRAIPADVQGIWLLTDLQTLTSQVVQLALGIQFRRHLPLMGATQKHALQGALFAADHSPAELGRLLATVGHRLIDGVQPSCPHGCRPKTRLTVNRSTAQAIGVSTARLRRAGAEIVQ